MSRENSMGNRQNQRRNWLFLERVILLKERQIEQRKINEALVNLKKYLFIERPKAKSVMKEEVALFFQNPNLLQIEINIPEDLSNIKALRKIFVLDLRSFFDNRTNVSSVDPAITAIIRGQYQKALSGFQEEENSLINELPMPFELKLASISLEKALRYELLDTIIRDYISKELILSTKLSTFNLIESLSDFD